jgi:hypothetical protein
MHELILGITVGVIGSVIAAIIYASWTGSTPLKKLKELIFQKIREEKIKKRYLGEFDKGRLPGSRTSLYYYRDFLRKNKSSSAQFGAPFELLEDDAIELRKLRAFLIPPLDNGRRNKVDDINNITNISLAADINIKWHEYFQAIGRKARLSRRSNNNKAIARRIVFLDKSLIEFIFSDMDAVIAESQISTDGKLIIPKNITALGILAQYSIKMAIHLMTIHQFSLMFAEDVETMYMDKSIVRSNQYYDFGLYDFSGVKLVYMPQYLKSRDKKIVGDRVYISESRRQRQLIREFEQDFDELWKVCEEEASQGNVVKYGNGTEVNKRKSLTVYTVEDFQEMYFMPLCNFFSLHLNWDSRITKINSKIDIP